MSRRRSLLEPLLAYLFPFGVDAGRLAERLLRRPDVRAALEGRSEEERRRLRGRLEELIAEAAADDWHLKVLAAGADTIDKFLVPLDAVGDLLLFVGGPGIVTNAVKEALELPAKVINTLYYAYRTGDLSVLWKDLFYELASILVPGSVLDLTNRYARRADRYIAGRAARSLLDELGGSLDSSRT